MNQAETVDAVRRACIGAGEQDPIDEAAVLALKHGEVVDVRVESGGFAFVHHGDLALAVAPDARGRGVGGRLAEMTTADAVHAWSHGDHPAASHLALRHGFARTRELWVMRRPTAQPLPPLTPPDGVTVRGFEDGDLDDVLRINAAAFAYHPEQGALDADGFAQRTGERWWEPAGLLVAVEDGAMLGFHWTKVHDADHGEVYVVGVAPEHQGRGLGRLLTLAGLHHLAARGVAEVHLYVESDNAPAVGLYTSLGFTHAERDTHVQFTRAGSRSEDPSA